MHSKISPPPDGFGVTGSPFETAEPHTYAGLKGIKVLLVEDEVIVAMEVGLALEDAGAKVVGPIDRLSKGLALLSDDQVQIDVAILDINLHGQEVFPIAERLMQRGVPFLFHTGHGTFAELGSRFPGAVICSKPVTMERLLKTASGLLS